MLAFKGVCDRDSDTSRDVGAEEGRSLLPWNSWCYLEMSRPSLPLVP